MSASVRVAIESVAFWSSRLPDWDLARAVIRGEAPLPQTVASRPTPSLLAAAERRRAPDTVALAMEVASKACDAAGRAPADLASVFASTHGDLVITDSMCATLATTPTLVSPVKFHNSVHNAAAGYWSIGAHSHAPYTALSAFHHTFGIGLLEAATQVICDDRPVLYVAFDIAGKGPLSTVAPSQGLLAAALVLAPSEPSSTSLRMQLELHHGGKTALTAARSDAARLVSENALAPCFPFFETLALRESTVTLGISDYQQLRVRFTYPMEPVQA